MQTKDPLLAAPGAEVIGISRPAMQTGGSLRAALLVVVLAFCAALPFLSPSNTFQFTIVLAVGLAGLGVALLLEAGLMSFGHALFYGMGAYTVAALAPLLAHFGVALLLCGAVAGAVLAAIVGLFIVRYRGVFFAMLNLALSMVAYSMLLKSYSISGGSEGLAVQVGGMLGHTLGPGTFGRVLFYVALGSVIVIGVLLQRYRRSPAGWGLGAIEDRELRIEYLGVSANRLLLQAYIISGFLGGLGGGIAASAVGHIAPDAFFWTTSTALVVVAVLGGRGVVGPFLGAALYELLSIAAARYLSNSWEILLGVVILLVIRFARNGFAGLPETWHAAQLRWRQR
ncbi:MAG: branched-chain amino acid ABC transporter permease [Acetobacteraceae bacterium]